MRNLKEQPKPPKVGNFFIDFLMVKEMNDNQTENENDY